MGQYPLPTPPTSSLPPLKRLVKYPVSQVQQALQNLREIYFPPPSSLAKLRVPKRQLQRRIHDRSVPDSGYASAEEEDAVEEVEEEGDLAPGFVGGIGAADPDILRSDPFERAFSIKWLTGFISRADDWLSTSADEAEEDERCEVLDDVSALLAKFAGDDLEDTGALTRKFSFPTAQACIEVELNDAALSKEDHTSVGLQSWASSIVLARRMCLAPADYGLDNSARVLELGAGTGLLSVVAAKLLGPRTERPVIATDYHPDVLSNLRQNVVTNFSDSVAAPVEVQKLDWENPDYSPPLDQPFDVIPAADVIYHPEHASWIKRCVERLLIRPSTEVGGKGGIFWLIIPMRTVGRHEGMGDTVAAVFPFTPRPCPEEDLPVLGILTEERLGRQEGVGRADEGGYRIFKIGWI